MPRAKKKILKETELRLVSELMKNSRRSDRELARAVSVSQPTASRMIKKLEKEEIIREYTMIPDFVKLSMEILAFTFGVWSPERIKDYSESQRIEEAKKFIQKHPNVIFASSGLGLGMGRMIMTAHKNYSDYSDFMREARNEWAGLVNLESFVISMRTDAVIAPFSLRDLMDYVRKTQE
jgi:DNA-binding Lrp family transcriptional regulator